VARWLFGRTPDAALEQVLRIKSRSLSPLSAGDALNAYQWCKAVLSKDHPTGLVAVQRFEADSKFFRSFAVLLAGLAVGYALRYFWAGSAPYRLVRAAGCIGLLLPVLCRYADQRFKATQHAYWFTIALENMKAASTLPPLAHKAGEPTHAGGVVFRECGSVIHYLVVEATDRMLRVLPKGHIEPGEDPRETAVREVHEETGHWARIVDYLRDERLETAGGVIFVRFFLMELVEEAKQWPKENRECKWLSLSEALLKIPFAETRDLLQKADLQRDLAAKAIRTPSSFWDRHPLVASVLGFVPKK